MKAFFAGLSFLTILPSPMRTEPADLARSLPFFPAVGLIVGGLAALLGWAFSWILPATPAAVLTVTGLACLSGGLHLDGLADTADGFFSHRPRERVLEIMRDSRIGTMGVLAVVFCLLVKISTLAALPVGPRLQALLLMAVAGRVAMLINLRLLPYARTEGLGTAFFGQHSSWPSALGSGILLALGWALFDRIGLAIGFSALLGSAGWAFVCRRRIGGATGDTLGAASEWIETLVSLATAISLHG